MTRSSGASAAAIDGRPIGRSEVRLFLGVFLLVGFTATLLGMAAPMGLDLPSLRRTLGLATADEVAESWGEVRYVHTGTRVRAARSTGSATVRGLVAGDSVRVDFEADGWYAVFPVSETVQDETRALGYVYAPLLKPQPFALAGVGR